MKKNTKLFFLFAVLVFVDQTTKHLSTNAICNKNIAWNIQLPPAIFYLVWLLIIVTLVCLFVKTKFYFQQFFIVLVFSGAISNMIDRVRLGCVIDYIDLKFWPVFNLADVYITFGVIMLVINLIKNKSREVTR
jgi:signal peptidase II